jgi:hypothetical protein
MHEIFQNLSEDTHGQDDSVSLLFFVAQKRRPSKYDVLIGKTRKLCPAINGYRKYLLCKGVPRNCDKPHAT